MYTNDSVRICVRLCDLCDVKNRQLTQYLKGKDSDISLNYDLRYLYAIIASPVIRFYFFELICGGLHIYPNEIRIFPIKKVDKDKQKPFIKIVDKILAITGSGDYSENPAKQAKVKEYENQIDQLVYKLYELTPEEIKIVENSNKK